MESPIFHDELSRIARAVGHPHRMRVLDTLAQGEHTVDALTRRLDVQLPTLSSHLKVLRDARLVQTRREGTRIHYSIADDSILALLLALRTVAERRSAEVQQVVHQFLSDRDDLVALNEAEFDARMQATDLTLIDVRPHNEYESGHIPGAISVPLHELEESVTRLPVGGSVVAYCRDRYCVLAPDAARRLKSLGYEVAVLDAGYTEWAATHALPAKEA